MRTDNQLSRDGLDASGELEEIDDNIAQYTVEQFLDPTVGGESELSHRKLKPDHQMANQRASAAASGRGTNKHGLF